MSRPFMIDEQIHHSADVACPSCGEAYPRPCACGGLIHSVPDAADIEAVSTTRCDQCGRSEDDSLEDEVA